MCWKRGQGRTHIHIYNTCTHCTRPLIHTTTNPAGPKWARHFDIDLFFLTLPFPPTPIFHFFIFRAESLVRIPAGTSQSDSPGFSWGGRGGEAKDFRGLFRRMERGKGGWVWKRRRNNKLTANDGMPGCYPQWAGLHTDQQLPESIWIITNIYTACWPTTASLNTHRHYTVKRCSRGRFLGSLLSTVPANRSRIFFVSLWMTERRAGGKMSPSKQRTPVVQKVFTPSADNSFSVLLSWQTLKSQRIRPLAPFSLKSSRPSLMWSLATTGATWWLGTTSLSKCGTFKWRTNL